MSNVNLMPEEVRVLKGRRRTRALAVLGAVLAVLVLAGLAFLMVNHLASLEGRLEKAALAYEACRPALAKQAELTRLTEELSKKQVYIAQGRAAVAWSDLLETVDAAVPRQVLLREESAAGGALVLQGSAPDLVEVARLMSGLWESGRFATVEVVFPAAFPAPQPAVGSVEFVVTATVAPRGAQ